MCIKFSLISLRKLPATFGDIYDATNRCALELIANIRINCFCIAQEPNNLSIKYFCLRINVEFFKIEHVFLAPEVSN